MKTWGFVLAVALAGVGCAHGRARVTAELGSTSDFQPAPNQKTVESLMCSNREAAALSYCLEMHGSTPVCTEVLERAREAVKDRPGCCLADPCKAK